MQWLAGLPRARGTNVTDAVKRALGREPSDIETDRAVRDRELRRLFAGFDQNPPVRPFRDRDMYDEDGLPR
jgi:hypothetical protein